VQLPALTPLRGVAALWVVVFHVQSELNWLDVPPLLAEERSGLIGRGYLWVDFFFLLSGFIMNHVYGEELSRGVTGAAGKRYLLSRLARVYPIHLVMLAAHVAFYGLILVCAPAFAEELQGVHVWKQLPANIVLLQSVLPDYVGWNYPSWSISAEWWTYILALPFFALLRGRSWGWTTFVVLASVWMLVAAVGSNAYLNLNVTPPLMLVRCVAEFFLGMALYRVFVRRYAFAQRDSAAVLAAAAVLLLFHFPVNDLAIVPAFALLLLTTASNAHRVSQLLRLRVFEFLGEISFSIYMVHALCLWAVRLFIGEALRHKMIHGSMSVGLVFLVVSLGLTIAVATLTYRAVEVPVGRWARARLGAPRGVASLAAQAAPEPSPREPR
jgi:peptidoglycan/LPS O-acetylase OafA/YrhL